MTLRQIQCGVTGVRALLITSSTLWVKKQHTWLLIITAANVDRFIKYFHWQIHEKILCTRVIKILHLTYLHYLVKRDNIIGLQLLQWHIACET